MELFAIFLLLLSHLLVRSHCRFYVIRQWKYVNFTWPDEETLRNAESKGLYDPQNIVISGVDYFQGHYYLTLPRMKTGVPATLARIKSGFVSRPSPELEPFPSWQMNDLETCDGLQNVQNVEIDPKGQVWIIDTGRINTLTNPIVKCSPKLIVFDAINPRTVITYHFPEEVASKNDSFLYDLVVDDTDGGYAYITDNSANDPGIIVYSVRENRSWKVRNDRSMRADPSASAFSVNGVPVTSPISLTGIALGPRLRTSDRHVTLHEDRDVYYCPLSSLHVYRINTTTLRNDNITDATDVMIDQAIKDVGTKASQSSALLMDNQGTLYFTLLGEDAIAKWDTHTPFGTGQTVIARDDKYVEWPNSMTFDQSGNLTVLVNRLEKFVFDRFNLDEYNFRLITAETGRMSYLYDNVNYESGKQETTSQRSTEVETTPKHSNITDDNSTVTISQPVKMDSNATATNSSAIVTMATGATVASAVGLIVLLNL